MSEKENVAVDWMDIANERLREIHELRATVDRLTSAVVDMGDELTTARRTAVQAQQRVDAVRAKATTAILALLNWFDVWKQPE